jgi:hypothetical protein
VYAVHDSIKLNRLAAVSSHSLAWADDQAGAAFAELT